MQIKILTKEESIEYWEREKEELRKWTTKQIIEDARMMLNMPDMGNTKYILSHQYDEFYKWLETEEAREQWNILPKTLHLAKYYLENKTK